MSLKRIAINGFGRIGRLTFRNLIENDSVEVVAINDLTDNAMLAHLLKFDTAHGRFNGSVESDSDHLIINGKKVLATAIANPEELPWKENEVDVVLECTGRFRDRKNASKHLKAGAKKVIISAPASSTDIKTIVLGVNDHLLTEEDTIVSNASCTTNCLAPVVKIILDNWGLEMASMTTTHAYTADQRIQDAPHKDMRRARAAATNIVPTSTGAAKALGLVIPEAEGKIGALAFRVPIITGSLIELNAIVDRAVSKEEVNAVFKKASESTLNGILEYSEDPLVSSDIVGNKHSSIFDSLLTATMGKMVKVVSWYDNEAGYSARLADLAVRI